MEASNYKRVDDVSNKLHGTGIRRGGMWSDVTRRPLKGAAGHASFPLPPLSALLSTSPTSHPSLFPFHALLN